MFHRLYILITLASWSFAWFSASVHVHNHPSHECHHHVVKSVPHPGAHTHCHATHNHHETLESGENRRLDDVPAVSGGCPLCDLIALELAATPLVEVASSAILTKQARLPRLTATAIASRYSLRGRAPPAC